MTNYRKLVAWQKGRDVVREVYQVTRRFPKEELYCLSLQMRRAAISVINNIAESQSRRSRRERCRFFSIAFGSAFEVETQAVVAQDLDYVTEEMADRIIAQTTDIARILHAMIRTLSA